MRAAVLTEVNKPLQILDLEQEAPRSGEVRVRVKAAGVCMSDWHIINGDWPLPLPMVLGHEAAGIVLENGPGVVEKSGSWFSYEGQRVGQGRENAKAYLREHADVGEAIERAIRANAGLVAEAMMAAPAEMAAEE